MMTVTGNFTIAKTEDSSKLKKGSLLEFGFADDIRKYRVTSVVDGEREITVYFESAEDEADEQSG